MTSTRRIALDELSIRPGTYYNPQTEVLIVVDDSPEVDQEIFATEEFDETEWVQISEELPVDEDKREDLIEHFRVTYKPTGELAPEDDEDLDEDELDAELEADDMEFDRE
jgi:hypothetical protein